MFFFYFQWDSYDSSLLHKDLVSLQPCFYEAQKLLHSTGENSCYITYPTPKFQLFNKTPCLLPT